MKLIELKEEVFPFPEDSDVKVVLPNGQRQNFTITHQTLLDAEGEIIAYEILLCPNYKE
jgi:hypothetical protein